MLEYIKKQTYSGKKKLSRREIATYMASKELPQADRTAEETTDNMIDEAAESGSIILTEHQRQGESDKIEFNDSDNFNILSYQIDNLEKLVNDFTKITQAEIQKMNLSKDRFLKKHINNLILTGIIILYTNLTTVTVAINAHIKNTADRESLYLRLAKVVLGSIELNDVILPLVTVSHEEMLDEMDRLKIARGSVAKDLVVHIISLKEALETLRFNLGQLD